MDERALGEQARRLREAEKKLVLALDAALRSYDQQAALFGVPLADGRDDCPCPPCVFLRSCRALVGSYEDAHGPLVR